MAYALTVQSPVILLRPLFFIAFSLFMKKWYYLGIKIIKKIKVLDTLLIYI